MKKVLSAIPILVLPILAACGEIVGQVSPADWTAMIATQTAMMWTPTVIPTVDPNKLKILEWLNAGFPVDGLETMLDARYTAVFADFPAIYGTTYRTFRLEILCECAINSNCCVPEHMFVLTMQSMKSKADNFIGQVPPDVIRVDVICFNRSGRIGALSAGWSDVRDFLSDRIDGHTFAWRVTPSAVP
jgi:hypothetical protein